MSDDNGRRPGVDDPTPAASVDRTFRQERPAVLATLIRQVGDFQLAEDAVQDAFAAAVATWPREGVPDSPKAWITVTARRRAIDRLRRERSTADRTARLAELARIDAQEHPIRAERGAVADDRLRLPRRRGRSLLAGHRAERQRRRARTPPRRPLSRGLRRRGGSGPRSSPAGPAPRPGRARCRAGPAP